MVGQDPRKKTSSSNGAPTIRNPWVSVFRTRAGVRRVHQEQVILGAVESADVRLSGEGVSPNHAILEIDSSKLDAQGRPEAILSDLASTTGVFINGSKVIVGKIKSGDVITIGREKIEFALESVEEITGRIRFRQAGEQRLFQNPTEDLAPLILEREGGVPEIFDYTPVNRPAVEVIFSWQGTILEVLHLTSERSSLSLGSDRRNDIVLPESMLGTKANLVTRDGTGFQLELDSRMSGVIRRKGNLVSVTDLVNQIRSKGEAPRVALEKGDVAKIELPKGLQFYIHQTLSPPKMKRRALDRDPFFLKVLVGSLAMSAAVIAVLLRMPLPQPIEAEQLPDRIATLLYVPAKVAKKPVVISKAPPAEQKPAPPQTPAPVPTSRLDLSQKQPEVKPEQKPAVSQAKGQEKPVQTAARAGQSEAKAGKGARAKGPEGARGKPTARETGAPQTLATRPSAEGGEGRGSGKSQVPDQGNIDMLKGASAQFLNLLGNSAQQLGKGGEKIAGFGGFTTVGKGGQALSGSGKGGGGTADTLAGGLADSGRGGGAVGTGKGAIGNGNGIIGGRARVAIRSGGPEEAIVMGAIDADAVERALLAHRDEFRLCYEREINAENPRLAGRVGTSFVIGASGRVSQAGVESSSLKSPAVERCVLDVIRRIQFPIPRGGGVVQVAYPFKFNPLAGK